MDRGVTIISPLTRMQYTILETIGEGTYAVCYAAKKAQTEELFCLKQIRFYDLDEEQRQNAAREAQLHSSLRHEAICGFYEAFLFTPPENGQTVLFLVLELCYCNLQEHILLRQRHNLYFDVPTVLYLFLDIASALAYLHTRGVVHRDLATKNLLCTFDKDDYSGRDLYGVKLCDFGVSAAYQSTPGGMLKTVVGTPQTMAPEVLAGTVYDASVDIWSAGCCFYEIFTLKQLFEGYSFPQLIYNVDKWEGVDFDTRAHLIYDNLEFSAEAMSLIGHCLSRDPKARPTASQLEAEVLRLVNKFAGQKQQDIVWVDFKQGYFLCNSEAPLNSPQSIQMKEKQLRLGPPQKKALPQRLNQINELKKKWKQYGKKGGEVEIVTGLPEQLERELNGE